MTAAIRYTGLTARRSPKRCAECGRPYWYRNGVLHLCREPFQEMLYPDTATQLISAQAALQAARKR